MKKIKKLFIISIIIGIFSIVVNAIGYFLFSQNNDNSSMLNQITCLISFISSTMITVIYIRLCLYKGEEALEKKWLLIALSILSLFGSILLLAMNFFVINAISNYVFEKRMKQVNLVLQNDKVCDKSSYETTQSIDEKAEILAREYKRLKELKDNNLINEKEYEEMKQDILTKIGLNSSQIEENFSQDNKI